MGQQPVGKKRIFMLDGSVQDEFGNTIEPARPGGVPNLMQPPAGSTAPGSDNGPGMTPKDALIGALKGGALASGFIPGAGLLGTSLRMAVPALFGAASAEVEGKDPVDAAALQGALGATGELAGFAPRVFNRAALASAGLFRGKGNLGKKATEAFEAINAERPRYNPILPGQVKRVEELKKVAGKGIEKAELATPGSVDLPQLGPANMDLYRNADNTARPISLKELIRADNREFIQQQAMERNGISPAVWRGLTGRQKNALINSTTLSARELGELERGMGKATNPVTKARREGVFVPEGERQQAQLDANRIKKANELKMDLAKNSGDPGELVKANKRFGNAATLDEAHNKMRFTGSLGDLSVLGARMGIAGLVGNYMGFNPVLSGIAGLGLLSPPALGATGQLTRAAGKALPPAYRTADVIDSLSEEERKKRARRRNPGE